MRLRRFTPLLAALLCVTGLAAVPGTAHASNTTGALHGRLYWTLVDAHMPAQGGGMWWRTRHFALTPSNTYLSGTYTATSEIWFQQENVVTRRPQVAQLSLCNPQPQIIAYVGPGQRIPAGAIPAVRHRNGPAAHALAAMAIRSLSKPLYESKHCPIYSPQPYYSYRSTGSYHLGQGDHFIIKNAVAGGIPGINPELNLAESWRIDETRGGTLGRMVLDSAAAVPEEAFLSAPTRAAAQAVPTIGFGYGSTQPFTTSAPDAAIRSVAGGVWKGESYANEGGRSLGWLPSDMPSGVLKPSPHDAHVSYSMPTPPPDASPRAGCLPGQSRMSGMNHLVWHPTKRIVNWVAYRRCLVRGGVAPYTDTATPAGAHLEVLSQILDDNGQLAGLIGGEASTSGMNGRRGWGSHAVHNLVERLHVPAAAQAPRER